MDWPSSYMMLTATYVPVYMIYLNNPFIIKPVLTQVFGLAGENIISHPERVRATLHTG